MSDIYEDMKKGEVVIRAAERTRTIDVVLELLVDEEIVDVLKANKYISYEDNYGRVFPKTPNIEISVQKSIDNRNHLRAELRAKLEAMKEVK